MARIMSGILEYRDYAQAVPWTELPNPKTMTIEYFDVDSDSTGRNTKGLMVRDRVAQKMKVSCTWENLTPAQVQTLADVSNYVFIRLRFYDPKQQAYIYNKTFYCGDRSTEVYGVKLDSNSISGDKYTYASFEQHFIER